MLAESKGKRLNKYVPDYVVFDLETTGTSCKKDNIIEISAVKVFGGKIEAEFSMLVNPQRPIPYYATQVNGITDEMVADAPAIDVAIKGFLDFVEDMILVGHNIHTFDMKFISRETMALFGKPVGNDYIDTLPLSRMYLPGLSHHTLSDLAAYYGISTDGAHRALFDCKMNQQVFERLAEEMKHPSEEATHLKICPKCGSAMKLRSGKYGEFWGCTGYPDCTHTEKIMR